MQPAIALALTLHNHQPIGNFGWVIADVFERAYRPMLDALERHPTIHAGLHYSGPLLDWLEAERPDFLARLRQLVDREQVELVGGGLYEPILIALPAADRRIQLERMARRVAALTGQRPRGAWLAERVWEPGLPALLAEAGYEWTIVDDSHFRAAALPDEAPLSAWRTEDQGAAITVFGTEQRLRYLVPFGKVEDVIEHLRRLASAAEPHLATLGDDGEKFGAWPTTFEHCWGGGRWVDRFFEALEANADWLATMTPSDWLTRHSPRGLAYLPGASYPEMGEWALPADESRAFGRVRHEAVELQLPTTRWLHGASWRNFLVKYREANDLHKQMLRTSRAVHAMPASRARETALDHLLRGQSNDCYWHGLFGGLYLPDLRVAALSHLIGAEDAARTAGFESGAEPDGDATLEDGTRLESGAQPEGDATLEDGTRLESGAQPEGGRAVSADLDFDGHDDILLVDPGQVLTVDLDDGAGIGSWDLRAARHPLAAVLRRRPEAYHARVRELEARQASSQAGPKPDTAATSIHQLVSAKEDDLARRLTYDDHERRLGLVRLLAPDVDPSEVAAGTARDLGDFVDGVFSVTRLEPGLLVVARDGRIRTSAGDGPCHVEKTLRLGDDRRTPELQLEINVENRSGAPFAGRIGVELPTMLLGGGGNPAAWWEVAGHRSRHDSTGEAAAVTTLAQGNDQLGIAITMEVEPAADAWWAPIETVSNSESGFERVYQGSSLLLSWPRTLAPGERFRAAVQCRVSCRVDLAAEEAAAGS